jgi:O-antigen/teichoic acid export membrane protein
MTTKQVGVELTQDHFKHLSLSTGSILMLIVKVVMFFLATGSGVIIARTLGPAGKGVFNLATSLPRLVGEMALLGMSVSCIRLLGEDSPYAPRTVISTFFTWSILWGSVWVAIGWLSYGYLQDTVLKGVNALTFGLALLGIPLLFLQSMTSHSLQGLNRIRVFILTRLSYGTFRFLGLCILLLLLQQGVSAAVLVGLGAVLFSLLIGLSWLHRLIPIGWGMDWNLLVRDVIGYGVQVSVVSSLMLVTYRVDLYIINYYSQSTDQAGYYMLAVSLAEILWYVDESVGVVLLPRLTRGTPQSRAELTATATRNSLFLTTLGALAVALVAQPAITLVYGAEYLPAVWPLVLLLPGIVTITVYRKLGAYWVLNESPLYLILPTGMGMIVNVGLNLWLVPRWGIAGAALVSFISYSLASVITLLLFLRMAPWVAWHNILLIGREDVLRYWSVLQGMKRSAIAVLSRR